MAAVVSAGPRPLLRRGGEPLRAHLLTDLRRRIAESEFLREFPGELAVAHEYGVSGTAREAISRLRQEGAVTVQRGRAQWVVVTAEFVQPPGAIYSLFAAVERASQEQRSIVRTLGMRADGVVAVRLGLEESSPLVHLERLRLAGDDPLALGRAWSRLGLRRSDPGHGRLMLTVIAATGLRGGISWRRASEMTISSSRSCPATMMSRSGRRRCCGWSGRRGGR